MKPKLITGDGRKQLPRHHVIAENVPDIAFNLAYSAFVSMGELTIKGRVYLDYGVPDFTPADKAVEGSTQ
jgi:hypothetical protein